jgi:DNA-binding NtrC family response regulator
MTGKIRVLIVDDEVKFLEAMGRRLKMRNLEVVTASKGSDALEIARTQNFDVALLDLKMPGLNGNEVLEILKREHKFLEVVILTGHGSMDSAVECTKLGAFAYLPKPYELEKLLEVLRGAYEARLRKKFGADQERMDKLARLAVGGSALSVLRAMREIDDEEK